MWGYRFETASVAGKRKWCAKRGFNTKNEAFRNGRDAQIQYENRGRVVIPSEMSYTDFLDSWLKSLVGVLKTTTIENYTKKAKLYLKPYLGDRKLNSITKDDIRELMLVLQASGCSESDTGLAQNTLMIIKGMIQKSFLFAVDEHMLPESPVAGRFPVPIAETYAASKVARTKPHVYIPQFRITEIFERFPEGTTDHIAMMFGYKCGLRIGEAFAVVWEDIDFELKILHVRRQVQWKQNQDIPQEERNNPSRRLPRHAEMNCGFWYFTNPKYDSKRDIRLDDNFVELLLKEKRQQEKDRVYYNEQYFRYYEDEKGRISKNPESGQEIHFVGVRRDGEFITPRTMQHTSSVIHHAMGYKEFDFHSLRHTHATMLVENGASPMYVQHRLGHKNLEVTLRVYFHYTDKMEEDGTEVLSKMFNNEDEC